MDKMFKKSAEARRDAMVLDTSRRTFLQVLGLGTVGFAVGCSASEGNEAGQSVEANTIEARTAELNAFVKVSTDNSITVVVKHIEMGQSASTGLTTLVAEEMDASWDQMRW